MTDWWIRLYYLDCDDAQEREDEPYVVINGETVWRTTGMRTGEQRRITGVKREFDRGHVATIQLREEDRGRDDLIGTRNVTYADVNFWKNIALDNPHAVFARSGRHFFGDARYTLWYAIGYIRHF